MVSRQFVVHYINEQNVFLFLVQILVLLGLARGLGEVFRRWRQPALTAEVLVGIVLGPSILGRLIRAEGTDALWSVLREAFGSQRVIRPVKQRR